jgi:secreted trypsin-like serine protease
MADYTNMLAVLAELKAGLKRLEAEVVGLQESEGSPGSAALDSQAQPQAPTDPPYIPPLVNDNEPEPIYGGSVTDGYPDCCAVGNEFMGYFCTGTLIAPNVVLTARHCAEDYNVTRVFLKGNDVSKPKKGETINVKEARAHPDPKVDLMLLVLEEHSKVSPRPIVRDGQFKPETTLVVGFGMINPSGTKGYGEKRKATVPVMTLDCKEMEDQARYGCWADVEMVAGHRGLKRDTCKGDSGGPLYVEDEEGKLFLLGVTSRGVRASGKPCGNGGIYVRADRFRDWIRAETNADV